MLIPPYDSRSSLLHACRSQPSRRSWSAGDKPQCTSLLLWTVATFCQRQRVKTDVRHGCKVAIGVPILIRRYFLRTANSELPHEMIEAIIDHLHDDKSTLNACSLVCKAWTHPARLHLLASPTVKWPLQPAVFPFVRHLYICMRRRNPSWNTTFSMLIGFNRTISLEINLLERSLNDINTPTWLALGNNFSRVVSLSLRRFRYSMVASLARLICAFPCLRKLSIHDVVTCSTYGELFEWRFIAFRLPPDLDTLELTAGIDTADTMISWLLSFPVHPPLRTVRLHQVATALVMLPNFIEAFGNGLESLSLSAHHGMLPYPI
jgi:hypothetical protein